MTTHIKQSAIAGHHPLHQREHLLRARDVDDLQMRDRIERQIVVVAHVRRAVGARFEVRGGGEHREVEAVPFAEPAVRRGHRLHALLMADCDAAQHLPVVERAERADPGVAAERGKRLADAHHVGLGDADVQRAPLIHGSHAGFETAGRCEIGVDRHHARIAREDFHRSSDDVARRHTVWRDRETGSCAAS